MRKYFFVVRNVKKKKIKTQGRIFFKVILWIGTWGPTNSCDTHPKKIKKIKKINKIIADAEIYIYLRTNELTPPKKTKNKQMPMPKYIYTLRLMDWNLRTIGLTKKKQKKQTN
jgi:hypothetical protein